MWINPSNQIVFKTHSEIRSAFNNVSFPSDISEDDIAFVGLLPVAQTQVPAYDSLTEKVTEIPPTLIDGEWTQQWQVQTLSPTEADAAYQASIPKVVTIRQAKLALLQAGLLDDIEAAMTQADRATQVEWEYATEFRRDWPALLAMQPLLGLTDTQVDDLFKLAATL